ncbi:unnamed protein product [Dovyalis caffra]|uniref:Uncharacterized protein n=1 Tax=Dovyalis caffra TaxID=77055 RepID=A0AAV1QQ09_9ROSI|nr:unnamed protein product [Dovyalis caffra]
MGLKATKVMGLANITVGVKMLARKISLLDGVAAELIVLVVEIGVMVAEVTLVVVEVTLVVGLEPMVVEALIVIISAIMRGVEEEGKATGVAGKVGREWIISVAVMGMDEGMDEGMGTEVA